MANKMTKDDIVALADTHFADRRRNNLPTRTFMATEDELIAYTAAAIKQATQQDKQRIEELKRQLAKFQTSEFHPDWSLLEATQNSLREKLHISEC